MKRSADELAFLPAAIEIQETPPSPIGRTITWVIIGVFVFSIIWAVLGKANIVAVAQGRIIPYGHSKPVQSLQIGTVEKIYIKEGDNVKKGDLLLDINSDQAQTDVDRLAQDIALLSKQITRQENLLSQLYSETKQADQEALFVDELTHSQWQAYKTNLLVLAQQKQQVIAERKAAIAQLDKLKDLLPIITQRANDQKRLVANKMLPKQQYLETEQQRIEVFHNQRAQKLRVEELKQNILSLASQRDAAKSDFLRKVLQRKEELTQTKFATEQQHLKAVSTLGTLRITSPADGMVQQLVVHNSGAVVSPSQQLMMIVPQDHAIEVEAALENKDIGFVQKGQTATIKIDAFPFTKYGTLNGEVVGLSPDAVVDETKGAIYKMRVLMEKDSLIINDRTINLIPGMTVAVEIKTGKRRLIEYFLSPLIKHANESVRER